MNGDNDRETRAATPDGRGDPPLERAWREASRELPPPHLDARILAAARAALGSEQPRSMPPALSRWSTLQRWQPLLAAAAVAGLAFVLVPMTLSPPSERAAAPTATDRVQAPSSPTPAYESAAPPRPDASDDVGEARPLLHEQVPRAESGEDAVAAPGRAPPTKRDAETPRPAAIPPPPMAAETMPDDAIGPVERSSMEPPTAGASSSVDDLAAAQSRGSTGSAASADRTREATTAAAPAAQATEERTERAKTAGASAWVERVESAYRRGDLATAARELRAFRAVEPAADALLPDDLSDWARTVR
jgi:hypothetical protein